MTCQWVYVQVGLCEVEVSGDNVNIRAKSKSDPSALRPSGSAPIGMVRFSGTVRVQLFKTLRSEGHNVS